MSMTNLDMMMWLRKKMNDCQEEIKYLEELLVTTNGPGDEIINSLNVNKSMYKAFETEYNRYYTMEMEIKNG
jgi:hypothetical protein